MASVTGYKKSQADALFAGKADLRNGLHPAVASGTMKTRAGLGRVRGGTGNLRVLCVGDSTTWGAQGGTYDWTKAYPQLLAGMLNTGFIPSASGFALAPSSNGGSGHTTTTDGRWVAGSGWILSPQGFGDGGSWQAPAGTSTNLTYTPGISCDTFDIYYVTNTGLGSFGASVDGGTVTNQATAGTPGIGKLTISAGSLSSSHVLTITPTPQIFIVAVDAYNSTVKQVRIANAGVSATNTSNWTGTGSYHGLDAIKAYAPDLTIIMFGINDASAGFSSSTFQTNLSQIDAAAALSGDVVHMSCVPSATGSGAEPATEAGYQTVTAALAASNNRSYIDVYARFVDYPTSNSAGFRYDTKHPNTVGYADIAQACAAFFRSL